ncbi:MAG: PAS domain S-box protein [Halobacteriota archaeon]
MAEEENEVPVNVEPVNVEDDQEASEFDVLDDSLYKDLVEGFSDAVFIVNRKGYFIYLNQVGIKRSGYSLDKLKKMHFSQVLPEKYQEMVRQNFEKSIRGDPKPPYEVEYLTSDGRTVFVEINTKPIIKDGKFWGVLGVSRDITRRKKAEEALKESEEMYKTLVRISFDSVGITDLEGNIIHASDKAAEIYGFDSSEDLIGVSALNLLAPEDREKAISYLQQGAEEGFVREMQYTMLRKAGSRFYGEVNAAGVRDSQGNLKGFIVVVRDITERKKIENELKESKEMYEKLVKASPDAITVTDLEGNIIDISEEAIKLSSYNSVEEVLGMNSFDLIAPEDREKAYKHLQNTYREGFTKNAEYHLLRKDGSYYLAEVNSTLVRDAHGNPKAFIATIRDITESKNFEREMRRRLMRFNLKEENIYLVKESNPSLSHKVLEDLCKVGYPSMIISRTPESDLRKIIRCNFDFLWMGEKTSGKVINPQIEELESRVGDFKRKAILIDRLDYLLFKNTFEDLLSFVQHLKDLAYLNNLIIILSMDPYALDEKEFRLLEKECLSVESRHKTRLSEDLLEVLNFIYTQNNKGIKPIYKDIGKGLGLSRPTVEKRVRALNSRGYVMNEVKGRTKIVELTEKGWQVFLNF